MCQQKTLGQRHFQTGLIFTLTMHLNIKQFDPPIALGENGRETEDSCVQWGTANPFWKNSKTSTIFSTKKGLKKTWQKNLQVAPELIGVPSIRPKTFFFQTYCKDRTQREMKTSEKKFSQ